MNDFRNSPLNQVCGLNLIACLGSSMTMYFRYRNNNKNNRKYRDNYESVVTEIKKINFNKQLLIKLQYRENKINFNKVISQLNIKGKYKKMQIEFKIMCYKKHYNYVCEQIKVVHRKRELLSEMKNQSLLKRLSILKNQSVMNIYFKILLNNVKLEKNRKSENNNTEDNNYIII